MSGLIQVDGLERAALLLSTGSGPGASRTLHLAIGIFDGIHLGHQSVIETAIHSARRSGGLAGVLTFAPHPSVLLRPASPTLLMMPAAMKRTVLARLGVDVLIQQAFTRDYAAMAAEDFVPHLRRALPHLAAIYVGENWRFGRDRAGDVAMLVTEATKAGLSVYSAPRLNHNGAPISSSRLRELLTAGDIAGVNAMLGYTYFSEGVVQSGRQLARTLGFPTLNVAWAPELPPRYGVYAVEVAAGQNRTLKAVANYGLRPTVAQTSEPLLEVHLLEDSSLTYGDKLTANWLHFLRPESKFGGLEELRQQVEKDRKSALEYFARTTAG